MDDISLCNNYIQRYIVSLFKENCATVCTIEQSCKRCGLAPAVRVTLHIRPDSLHVVKGFLVDDCFMGILKNRPLAFIDVMNVYNHIAEKSHVENEMSKMNLPETVPAVV